MPDMPGFECGQCESFCFIGDTGCGYCQRQYDQWRQLCEDPKAWEVLDWVQMNGIDEGTDACEGFVEYE